MRICCWKLVKKVLYPKSCKVSIWHTLSGSIGRTRRSGPCGKTDSKALSSRGTAIFLNADGTLSDPLRAGLVKEVRRYPWSSYNVYAYGKSDDLTDRHLLYEDMGNEENQ